MSHRSRGLTGRSFSTTYEGPGVPVWDPLERLAHVVWQRPDVPQFHPGEFCSMGAIRNKRLGLRIHLYKHLDTRGYLNLDDVGHAYAYQPRDDDDFLSRPEFGGWYRRYRSPLDAIGGLGLWMFEVRHLYRSFPPEEWPQHEP